MKNKDCWFNSI